MTTILFAALLWLLLGQPAAAPPFALGEAIPVADGVVLFHPAASGLLDPPGPLAVQALQVDPARAPLAIALADGGTPARQPVATIAAQHDVLAAINASFFDRLGRQVGLLKVNGEVVARGTRLRGAVAWSSAGFVFDRVRLRVYFRVVGSRHPPVAIDHINPAASRSGLALYTAAFRLPIWGRTPPHAVAGSPRPPPTQPGSPTLPASDDESEIGQPPYKTVRRFVLDGEPLRVAEVLTDGEELRASASPAGSSRAVLAFRGRDTSLPRILTDLRRGRRVEVVQEFETAEGPAASGGWARARYAVAGAGLLLHEGRSIPDWTVEDLRAGFATERHPRTMIGADRAGRLWLVTVDGRRPDTSVGMSLTELQRLALALGLVDALNLDGGGSTTMVVGGRVINQPTDLIGPRAVPDAIVVKKGGKGEKGVGS